MTTRQGLCSPADPTLRLLLACAHLNGNNEDRQRINRMIGPGPSRPGPDWKRFAQLVDWHRIAPLVSKALDHADIDGVPTEVRATLARQVRANTRRALLQTAELTRLAPLFDAEEVRFLLLKGPGLALQAFGDLGLRHAGDLDLLLIDPTDLWKADALLKGAGYVQTCPGFELSPRQQRTYTRAHHDFSYAHHDHGLRVELHWRWTANPDLFPLSPLRAWKRRQALSIANIDIHIPASEDLLLYLCVHGAKHAWFRLLWLCDLPVMARAANPPLDADTLAQRGRELGVSSILSQGLALAQHLLGTSLPASLTPLAGPVDQDHRMFIFPCRAIALGRALRNERLPLRVSLDQFRYLTELRPEIGYKRRELSCYTIRYQDWRLLPLPDWLLPLYPLLRPALWALRRLSGRADGTPTPAPTPPGPRGE